VSRKAGSREEEARVGNAMGMFYQWSIINGADKTISEEAFPVNPK
jgi:hypothetical protein